MSYVKAILRTQESEAILTLAANTALKIEAGQLTITEDFRMARAEVAAHIEGLTATEGSGVMFGICNGELTEAEIAECLVADGPTNPTDRLGVERAGRFVRILSQSEITETDTTTIFKNDTGGPLIKEKVNWTFTDTNGWDWFIYNDGPGAFQTGATVRLLSTIYGGWLL